MQQFVVTGDDLNRDQAEQKSRVDRMQQRYHDLGLDQAGLHRGENWSTIQEAERLHLIQQMGDSDKPTAKNTVLTTKPPDIDCNIGMDKPLRKERDLSTGRVQLQCVTCSLDRYKRKDRLCEKCRIKLLEEKVEDLAWRLEELEIERGSKN
jgi:hypothetical protein